MQLTEWNPIVTVKLGLANMRDLFWSRSLLESLHARITANLSHSTGGNQSPENGMKGFKTIDLEALWVQGLMCLNPCTKIFPWSHLRMLNKVNSSVSATDVLLNIPESSWWEISTWSCKWKLRNGFTSCMPKISLQRCDFILVYTHGAWIIQPSRSHFCSQSHPFLGWIFQSLNPCGLKLLYTQGSAWLCTCHLWPFWACQLRVVILRFGLCSPCLTARPWGAPTSPYSVPNLPWVQYQTLLLRSTNWVESGERSMSSEYCLPISSLCGIPKGCGMHPSIKN